MKIAAYLNFDGNCAEAFRFYAEALGGKIAFMQTFGESPMAEQAEPEAQGHIMHARLEVGDQIILGSDAVGGRYHTPKGFAVSLQLSPAEAERVWEPLSQGAQVEMPLQQTFWAERFGMLRDRFGIPWIINGEEQD